MPNLKHLLEELKELDIAPEEIRIPGQLYDSLIADAEEAQDEDAQEEE